MRLMTLFYQVFIWKTVEQNDVLGYWIELKYFY